jgi:2-iminobutanoate/2-iminopropanoate deaminase
MKRLSLALIALAVVSVLVLATVGFAPQAKGRHLNLPGRSDNLPFSHAVLVGDTLYLAGDIGIDPKTGAPPPDVKEEVRILMDRMKQRLEMAGMTMGDLVSVQVFCPDLSLYEPFNEVYRTYFKGPFPARAFIGSGPLLLGGRFEVLGVAVKR